MRAVVACFLLVGALATVGSVAARAQGQPSISVSPQEGPPGTVLTITGEGFTPADTVYIEVFPVTGAVGGHGTVPVATVTADGEGEFDVAVVIPPEGFENWGRVYREYEVMAYAESFGNRTSETVEAAPKAIFTLTPAAWPPSGVGGGIAQGEGAQKWALTALGLAAAFGGAAAVMFMTARRRAQDGSRTRGGEDARG